MRVINYLFFLIVLILISCGSKQKNDLSKPNIVIILTDDQAFGDLNFTGNTKVKTPNIDLLAREGIFANHFYVSPVCAPTRASLLTGRYHQRTGVSGVTRGRENMNLDEETMADIFKSFGYKTGVFGKWHNGAHYPYHPLGRGFDDFVGFTSGHWTNYFNTTIEKNGKPFKTNGYLPDILTDVAIDFIEDVNQKDQPFLCFIPYQTPHTPLQVPDSYFDYYKNAGINDFNSTIYGMGENIDENVGKILKKLDDLNIRENTIIVYMSDNGPLNFRFNHNLKGKKGSVNEGGVRVPFVLNWKNKLDEKEIDVPLAHIDVLPTLLQLAGLEYNFKKELDGQSFDELLESNTATLGDRILFENWSNHKRAMAGDFLMVDEELFDIKNDPIQSVNIRNQHEFLYDSLNTAYRNWFNALPENKISKSIPVGYNEFPKVSLPAHEAHLHPYFEFRKDRKHTGIAYHSLFGWAHDWIDYWTDESAYPYWDIEIIEGGTFAIELVYALNDENRGVELELEIGKQKLLINNLLPFEHGVFENYDRILRDQEAPETDWNTVEVGQIKLTKGQKKLSLKSTNISGNSSIELKEIKMTKIKNSNKQ